MTEPLKYPAAHCGGLHSEALACPALNPLHRRPRGIDVTTRDGSLPFAHQVIAPAGQRLTADKSAAYFHRKWQMV